MFDLVFRCDLNKQADIRTPMPIKLDDTTNAWIVLFSGTFSKKSKMRTCKLDKLVDKAPTPLEANNTLRLWNNQFDKIGMRPYRTPDTLEKR